MDRAVRMKRRRQKITVAAPADAESGAELRQRLKLVATPQQEFSGPDRPGGENDRLGCFRTHRALPALETVVRHAITGARHGLDVLHQMERSNLRMVLVLGYIQVVAIEGVLRVHVAADVAVAEVDARALLGAVCVWPDDRGGRALREVFFVRPVGIEIDGDFQRPETISEPGFG